MSSKEPCFLWAGLDVWSGVRPWLVLGVMSREGFVVGVQLFNHVFDFVLGFTWGVARATIVSLVCGGED